MSAGDFSLFDVIGSVGSRLSCRVQPLRAAGHYLVSIETGCKRGRLQDESDRFPDGMPQARAVLDDFGDLVFVTGWH